MTRSKDGEKLLRKYWSSPQKMGLYGDILTFIQEDLDAVDAGALGSDLLRRLWEASYHCAPGAEMFRLLLLEEAGKVYPLEAFLCVPWPEASQAALWDILPQDEILRGLVEDESFTGTVAELLELARLLNGPKVSEA